MLKELKQDKLLCQIYPTREAMGTAAADDIAAAIRKVLSEKEEMNMIFAAAPSQNEVLAALVSKTDIPWERINAFHMDEYIGLPQNAPQRFSTFLKEAIFNKLPFKAVYCIDGSRAAEEECARYGKLLVEHPTDIVCLGIGENGHIAFNDPGVADFNDSALVKPVALDDVCRQQQVNDGCFAKFEDVPTTALTLTVPALTAATYMFCVVPAATKAEAVRKTICEPVSELCPASVLRQHDHAVLYCDADSGAQLL